MRGYQSDIVSGLDRRLALREGRDLGEIWDESLGKGIAWRGEALSGWQPATADAFNEHLHGVIGRIRRRSPLGLQIAFSWHMPGESWSWESINASAWPFDVANHRYCITFDLATASRLSRFLGELTAQRPIFDDLIPFDNPDAPDDEAFQAHIRDVLFGSTEGSPELIRELTESRQVISDLMRESVFEWIYGHELGHILGGHLRHRSDAVNHLSEIWPAHLASEALAVMRIQEFDADERGLRLVVESFLDRTSPLKTYWRANQQQESYFRILGFGLSLLMCYFSEACDAGRPAGSDRRYPRPDSRLSFLGEAIREMSILGPSSRREMAARWFQRGVTEASGFWTFFNLEGVVWQPDSPVVRERIRSRRYELETYRRENADKAYTS